HRLPPSSPPVGYRDDAPEWPARSLLRRRKKTASTLPRRNCQSAATDSRSRVMRDQPPHAAECSTARRQPGELGHPEYRIAERQDGNGSGAETREDRLLSTLGVRPPARRAGSHRCDPNIGRLAECHNLPSPQRPVVRPLGQAARYGASHHLDTCESSRHPYESSALGSRTTMRLP